MERPRELWGRRTVAIGTVLLAAAVIGGIILLIAGGSGGSSSNDKSSLSDIQARLLKKTVVVPSKGIQVRIPKNWSSSKQNDTVRIRSQDSCLVMTLAAPTGAGNAKAVMKQGVGYLRDNFKGVKVKSAAGSRVGGIPTRTNAVSLRNDQGDPINVVISVGSGKKYTYVTNVSASPNCPADLAAGQIVLGSVQYTK
jgi:hypothetical protein